MTRLAIVLSAVTGLALLAGAALVWWRGEPGTGPAIIGGGLGVVPLGFAALRMVGGRWHV